MVSYPYPARGISRLHFAHPASRAILAGLAASLWLAAPTAFAQWGPANEHNCPSVANSAEPPYVGSGHAGFSPNQSLCLPQLAPIGGPSGPLAFVVQGVEPGIRVDSQGTIYIDSIRGVPGGADAWRWYAPADGGANGNQTLPFKYEGQPDACGILSGGCTNNPSGLAPGGGDADIAVNAPDPMNSLIPNLAFVSLSLANVTATHSIDRGDNFFGEQVANLVQIPNPASTDIPGDDRMWIDADADPSTVYMNYHDVGTFNIEVQRSNDGGATYNDGIGEAIDVLTQPAASGFGTNSGNIAGQIRIDRNTNGCPSRGNLYQIFVAPDSAQENATGRPLRTVYVGVSTPAQHAVSPFIFTDYKIYTSPPGSPGATNGAGQIFPALATDNNGWVYAVWSDNTNIWFSSSSTQGKTWLVNPVRVNKGSTVGKANVFPWVAADANGHAVVAWLGGDRVGNSNTTPANWNVYAAETVNGNVLNPSFMQHQASDHIIHTGTVSTGGLGGSADRSLADFFQVALDPQHRANIAYADNHDPSNFHVGVPYFTRQLTANPGIVFPSGPSSCFQPVH
jgi:hypothetical protein